MHNTWSQKATVSNDDIRNDGQSVIWNLAIVNFAIKY